MPYGIEENETHIGALDLLDSDISYSLLVTGESLGGTESSGGGKHTVTVKDASCDLVIMNPPFTRPTNHEGGHADIPIPSFAGFGTRLDEQRAMSARLRKASSLFGSGYAGLASNFMDLGHRKLKDGGVLALVIPFAFARGKGWKKARHALSANYSDIHVLSIATAGSTAQAFSADTGMAECLVVATKRKRPDASATFSSLVARPKSILEAAIGAKDTLCNRVEGDVLDAGPAGVLSASLIKAARRLSKGQLRLPRQAQSTVLPVVALGRVAQRGLVDRDINGGPTDRHKTGPPQGPFVKRPLRPREVPDYPMLWAHSAKRERKIVVQADSCGDPRPGDDERAIERWNKATSRLHASRDFRLNAQSLAMCLTPEKCLGGRAWPNIIPRDERHEIPLLLWGNSTLGLILWWWKGTRQQAGRSIMTVTTLPDLPVLDPRTLTDQQLAHCNGLFKDLRDREFLPANEAYHDEARKTLDSSLLFGITSVLQLNPSLEEGLDVLRRQWCAEPSVHGGKSTRPATS